jgi:hypothetical protein
MMRIGHTPKFEHIGHCGTGCGGAKPVGTRLAKLQAHTGIKFFYAHPRRLAFRFAIVTALLLPAHSAPAQTAPGPPPLPTESGTPAPPLPSATLSTPPLLIGSGPQPMPPPTVTAPALPPPMTTSVGSSTPPSVTTPVTLGPPPPTSAAPSGNGPAFRRSTFPPCRNSPIRSAIACKAVVASHPRSGQRLAFNRTMSARSRRSARIDRTEFIATRYLLAPKLLAPAGAPPSDIAMQQDETKDGSPATVPRPRKRQTIAGPKRRSRTEL